MNIGCEITRMSSTDRLAKAGLENLPKTEAIIADLVQRFGPLPATNDGPAAGSAAPAAT